jgi:predicted CoA-binding protein
MMTTLVIGPSENPERYSYKAIVSLLAHQQFVVAIGAKAGVVKNVAFDKNLIPFENVDTVTLYINPTIQQSYYDYILSLKPRRVIFNPGTENDEFAELLKAHHIIAQEACTLVLLSIGHF